MGKMCKMDQKIPRIRWSREGFATGGAKGARKCKKLQNEQKSEK